MAVYIELHLMRYGIAYLALNSISSLCLITHLLARTCSSLLALKHQEIASVKHSFIIQVHGTWKPSHCVFLLLPNLREVPHGTKGTGPEFVTRPVYLRSQLRNNTNTVSTLVLLTHLLHVLCTQYTGIAHHQALQTSGRGWADSKAVHGMECSGARSLYRRSLSVGAAA